MQEQKVGSKLQCPTCGAEMVVVKASDQPITCCGVALGGTPNKKEGARG